MVSIKCNCDVALFEQEGITGIRCVLRDSQGHFLGCFASKIHGVLSPREAEVYGLHQAIRHLQKAQGPRPTLGPARPDGL